MIPNIVKGPSFRGLMNYLLEGRKGAAQIGGNMVSTTAPDLTREFSLIRSLKPNVKHPAMHHSLSFADGEFFDDADLAKISERYIQRMGLEGHQWTGIRHMDKAHQHLHLAINRIGLDGSWWNATRDWERAQVVAGILEHELGLFRVTRERLSYAVEKAVADAQIPPPEVPLTPPDLQAEVTHVMDEIGRRLWSIPEGLSAPEWILSAAVLGVHLKPSLAGEKLSGFTARMEGHRAVKISDVDRKLGWGKQLLAGRVEFDLETHLDWIRKWRDNPLFPPPGIDPANREACNIWISHWRDHYHDPETPRAAQAPPGPERTPDAHGALRWEWQPRATAGLERAVAPGDGSKPGRRKARIQSPTSHPGSPEPVGGHAAPPVGGGRAPQGPAHAARVRRHARTTRRVPARVQAPSPSHDSRPTELLLGFGGFGGSGGGDPGAADLHAGGPGPGPRGPDPGAPALGSPALPVGGSVAGGGVQAGSGPGLPGRGTRQPGGRGLSGDPSLLIGVRADLQDFAVDAPAPEEGLLKWAQTVVASEPLQAGISHKARATARVHLWKEAHRQGLDEVGYRAVRETLSLASATPQSLPLVREWVRQEVKKARRRAPGTTTESMEVPKPWQEPAPVSMAVEFLGEVPPPVQDVDLDADPSLPTGAFGVPLQPRAMPAGKGRGRTTSGLLGACVDYAELGHERGAIPRHIQDASRALADLLGVGTGVEAFAEAREALWAEAQRQRLDEAQYLEARAKVDRHAAGCHLDRRLIRELVRQTKHPRPLRRHTPREEGSSRSPKVALSSERPSPTALQPIHPRHSWELGWIGPDQPAPGLVGACVDFQDGGVEVEAIPKSIPVAAAQAIMLESPLPLESPDPLKVRTRETLWQETQRQRLTPGQYRDAKAHLAAINPSLQIARSLVRELTRQAKRLLQEQMPYAGLESGTPHGMPEKPPPSVGAPREHGWPEPPPGRSSQGRAKPPRLRKT